MPGLKVNRGGGNAYERITIVTKLTMGPHRLSVFAKEAPMISDDHNSEIATGNLQSAVEVALGALVARANSDAYEALGATDAR